MSSFNIRDFLNRAPRAPPTQSGSTQGGLAGANVGAASGPSSTAPTSTAASGLSSTTLTTASTSSSQGPPTLSRFPVIPCHDTHVGQDAAVEEVCGFLKDVDVGIVGIYGMGGVGKTALMKIVHNKFLVRCDFDFILWVVVSKELKYIRIRKEIIREIKCSKPNATGLYNFLLKKRFVLLLDDVWEHIDLIELGVPIPTNTNMCKIIFTTRSEDICREMAPDREIRVDCLIPTISWVLFAKNVGEKALKSHPRVAYQVMKECCGLPLALIIVGRAMSSKYAPEEWEHALQILHNNPYQMPGVEKKLFSCLELSYLSLEETSRKCFLYCSLFPEDFSIRKVKLVDYWIGEGFLGKCDNIEQLRNRGYHIIGGLLAACLIENGTDAEENEVKMHDVIRDMALWIVSDHGVKQNMFFVHPGHRLTFSEINDRWNAAERIFVWDLKYLPNSPSCLELTTLIFHKYYHPATMRYKNVESDGSSIGEKQIQIKGKVPLSDPDLDPDAGPSVSQAMGMLDLSSHDLVSSLFHFMPILRLLDLSSLLIGDLPKSVTALSKLRYLSSEGVDYLPHEVGRMSSLEIIDMRAFSPPTKNSTLPLCLQETVGQLLALRVLSLKDMWFHFLPQNIKFLCKLEILDLTYTHISDLPSTIVGLRELRQLLLGWTFLRRLPEKVVYLSKLEVLDLSYTQIRVLPSKIDRLSKLRLLNLKGTSLEDLPKDIFYLSMLKVLNLSSVRIEELPNINPSLSNSWRDKFGKTLGSAHSTDTDLMEVTKLETLDLSCTAIVILPNFISMLVELRHLNLEGTLICTLPENVMMLTKLEVLNLNSTKIKELPTSINQLQQLRELRLSKTLIERLPTELEELSKLEILDINQSINVPYWINERPKLRLFRT